MNYPPLQLTVWLCVVRVSEALHFHFMTKFYYLHNLSIYDKPRITYEPLLPTVLLHFQAFQRWQDILFCNFWSVCQPVRIANVYGFCVGFLVI